jgi:arylsulfatase A-like enzyme
MASRRNGSDAADDALTRRALLRRGGGGAAGAAGLLGLGGLATTATEAAAASTQGERRPNVVVIVADRLRADAIGAYDDVFDDRHTKTPNIDALADDSLRFRYAVPDGMPGIPMRRGVLTGMRSYPFRDWRATPGMPAIPGWHKVWDFQPLMPELTAANGVTTAWVTDNPTLVGPRFDFVRRTQRLPVSSDYTPTERDYLLPLRGPVQDRRQEPTERVLRAGIDLIDELKGRQPFLLGLDAFDPVDAFMTPIQYVHGTGPLSDDVSLPQDHAYARQVHVDAGDGVRAEVRDRYAATVRGIDGWVGRFLDKLDGAGLADDTVVVFVGDSGIALGEQGVFGHPSGVWHRRVYQVPFMVRDPKRRWAGKTSSWFVSSHDIPSTVLAYLGIVTPGKMSGEDLTTLFDDYDLPARPYFTTAIDTHVVVGNRNWLLLGRTDQDRWRLYETEDEHKPEEIRTETAKSPTVLEELKRYALTAAGGTLPRFDDTEAIRPQEPNQLDEKVADDGTLDSEDQKANELR